MNTNRNTNIIGIVRGGINNITKKINIKNNI